VVLALRVLIERVGLLVQQFPDPFGCDRARMKLKFGQTDVLKVTYMPWTEGTTHCTVLLTSAQHGQFCYEITGEATPCDTFMKVEFQCDIDGPQVAMACTTIDVNCVMMSEFALALLSWGRGKREVAILSRSCFPHHMQTHTGSRRASILS
jgi:hypothetical protein